MLLNFSKTENRSLPNLHVAKNTRTEEVGFIWKPKDTKTDKNAWRAFSGIGAGAKFLGHAWDKKAAMSLVQLALDFQESLG